MQIAEASETRIHLATYTTRTLAITFLYTSYEGTIGG
jgi:hypothetical protein